MYANIFFKLLIACGRMLQLLTCRLVVVKIRVNSKLVEEKEIDDMTCCYEFKVLLESSTLNIC